MKSIFQEASTLGKAVQKAWEDAGSPENFSVKVLKVGESGFWGFGGTPFTISVSTNIVRFEPSEYKSQSFSRTQKESKDKDSCKKREQFSDSTKREQFSDSTKEDRLEAKSSSRFKKNGKPEQREFKPRTKDASLRKSRVVTESAEVPLEIEADNWTESLALRAVGFFKEAVSLLDIEIGETEYVLAENVLTLRIKFAPSYMSCTADKSIFISIAPLVVQMAKKSTGETLRGLKLTIDVLDSSDSRD